MSLETLPYDVSQTIYSLACSDGGRAGAALARVSRTVRAASAEHAFESIALSGFYQISKFLRALRKRTRKDQPLVPPIYDLFLSTQCPCFALSGDLYPRKDSWDVLQGDVLRISAPTLRTLTLMMYDEPMQNIVHVVHLLAVPLPRLRELTLRGQWAMLRSIATMYDPVNGYRLLGIPVESLRGERLRPKLRQVHLAAGRTLPSDLSAGLLRLISPEITHLRLSILVKGSATLVARLLHAEYFKRGLVERELKLTWLMLDSRFTSVDPSLISSQLILPPHLHLLLVQPPPGTIQIEQGHAYDIFDSLKAINIIKALERETPGGAFVHIPLHAARGYGWREARTDWEDRIVGGPGCWVEREDSHDLLDDSDAPTSAPCAGKGPQHLDSGSGAGSRHVASGSRFKTLFRIVTKLRRGSR